MKRFLMTFISIFLLFELCNAYQIYGEEYIYIKIGIYSEVTEPISFNVLLEKNIELKLNLDNRKTVIQSFLKLGIFCPLTMNTIYETYKIVFKTSNYYTEHPSLFLSEFNNNFKKIKKTEKYYTKERDLIVIEYGCICGIFVQSPMRENLLVDFDIDNITYNDYYIIPISVLQYTAINDKIKISIIR